MSYDESEELYMYQLRETNKSLNTMCTQKLSPTQHLSSREVTQQPSGDNGNF